jgi:hypothetical protein
MLTNWLRAWTNRASSPRRSPPLRKPPRRILGIEILESRALLSASVGVAGAGVAYTGSLPPDPCGAVGPNHYVETVNTTLAIYNRGGTQLSNRTLQTFFSSLPGVQGMSDPFVTYDTWTGKFVVGVLDLNSVDSRLDFAVSSTSDPTGSWTFRRFDMTHDSTAGTYLSDFPRFGYNPDAYVVGFNMAPNGSGSQHVDTLSIRKSDLAGFVYAWPTGTVQVPGMTPTVMHDNTGFGAMWLVGTGSGSNIKVLRMSNELSSSPTIQAYSVSVPSYSNSIPALHQPGGTFSVSIDGRMLNAAMLNGMLVASHTVGLNGDARARWYEFDTLGISPTLVQSGQVGPATSTDTYYPTIEMNKAGSLGLTYMESSPTEYMSMYVTGRSAGDPVGQMETGVSPAALHGTGNYTLPRAGDFSGMSVDPTNGLTFWATNEFKGSSTWNTGFASFSVGATHLNFVEPATVTAGTPFTITVQALDGNNQPDTGYLGMVYFNATNGAMANYTFTAADQGQHAFTLTLTRAGTLGVTGIDTTTGITGTTSFVIAPAAPDHINFSEPATVTAGVPFAITVTVQDAYNNTVTGYTNTVHFTATNGAMADYTFQHADMGQRTFNIVLNRAQTLGITASDMMTGISGNTSFTIVPAAADHLVFLQQPTDTMAGHTISPAVMVAMVDQFGNVETGDNTDVVTLSLSTNPGGGTLSGTLTMTVSGGLATFSDLSINLPGVGYTLHASVGGGLPDIDSDPFTITM